MSQKAWMQAYIKGSKSLQARLAKIHANNPEFQDFVKKHGFGGNLSAKQAEKQKKTSIGVQQTEKNAPTSGPEDRLALIRAAAEKKRDRKLASANRAAFGGELGGGFSLPNMGFRTYRESLDYKVGDKVRVNDPGKLFHGYQAKVDKINPDGSAHVSTNWNTVGRTVTSKQMSKVQKQLKLKLEAREYKPGDKVLLHRDYAGQHAGLVFTIDHTNADGDHWIGRGASKSGWYVRPNQIVPWRGGKKVNENTTKIDGEKEMSKALNELRKATLASYLSKAGGRIRSATKIAGDFEADHYKAMATANKHHPNMVTPGFEKDPEKLKKAETQMKVTGDLRDTFKRDAYNRIRGIARAGRLLAKEETINERNTESHPELWATHELRHESGKALKKGDKVKGFRGTYTIHGFEMPHHEGSTGRVYTNKGSFFPGVVNAKIVRKKEPILARQARRGQIGEEINEMVSEAPLSPEHKAAIKALKSIPSHYSHRDLQSLRNQIDSVADKADNAEYSARYAKQQRVQKKNKNREVIETGSSIKNKEGHILHMKKRSRNAYDFTAHIGRGGPQVDSGSWSAIRYKHKIGGYNKHFNAAKAVKEEAEQIDEISQNTLNSYLRKKKNRMRKEVKLAAPQPAQVFDAKGKPIKGKMVIDPDVKRAATRKQNKIVGKFEKDTQPAQNRIGAFRHGLYTDTGAIADHNRKNPFKGALKKYWEKGRKFGKAFNDAEAAHQKARDSLRKKAMSESSAEQIDEISRSTIAKVAQARFNQAQKALKDKNMPDYVVKMKKAIKASDATVPKTGWSPEEDPKNEEVISSQEKYRQIREAKLRKRKGQ